jgi:hemoglobin/transferrin/lactoferrin receptor protein
MYDGQLSDIQAIINTGFAKIYGITAQSHWQINDFLRWNNGFNWISGYDNDGNSIRHAPPIYGNSSLNLVFRKWQFRLEAFYNGEIAFEDLAPIEADKPDLYAIDSNGNPYSPAWFVLNFKSIYQLSQSFSIHLEMENLTDKRYRTYSSGVSAPGRGFRISLNYKF